MAELTDKEFAAGKRRGDARLRGPRAESVRYDATRHRVSIVLTTGIELVLDPARVEGLQQATADELADVEVEALGLGIRFPRLDADLHVPALLQGISGTRRWMAAQLGASGGRARSPAKAAAARANGKHGGRPRKPASAAAQ